MQPWALKHYTPGAVRQNMAWQHWRCGIPTTARQHAGWLPIYLMTQSRASGTPYTSACEGRACRKAWNEEHSKFFPLG